MGTPPTQDVDYGALQNTVQGGIRIGTSRTARVLVHNTSKKTPLTLTEVSVAGTNPGDFSIDPVSLRSALDVPIAPNQGAAVSLRITFTPAAEGVRAATLRLVSNAGSVLPSLTGVGLAPRPIIVVISSLSFTPVSAPATAVVHNDGGEPLVLSSIAFGGENPAAFQRASANRGFSNCFDGILLGAHGRCYLAIALAPGAVAPSNALLVIQSNDPSEPETDIALTLTP